MSNLGNINPEVSVKIIDTTLEEIRKDFDPKKLNLEERKSLFQQADEVEKLARLVKLRFYQSKVNSKIEEYNQLLKVD